MAKLKYFLALSRTPHGLLDMATPALAALIWSGAIPPVRVILLGVITAFSGYSAVYALNDLVDYRHDEKKLKQGGFQNPGNDLDAILVRHPMAHGFISFKEGLLWTAGWAALALIGAFLLNPFCLVVFMGGCLLETAYCLLWGTSNFRTVVSGGVKTAGGIAAVFAVDPGPSPIFLLVLFFWLFFWEIGGQNIPNDWSDMEEDRLLQAETIPIRFGPVWANFIIFSSLIMTVVLNGLLLSLSRMDEAVVLTAFSLVVGTYLLLYPAYRLLKTSGRGQALVLFNRASYYPLTLLVLVSLFLILRQLNLPLSG
jgi:4-hydroxybenzoate polyprenyltransferase